MRSWVVLLLLALVPTLLGRAGQRQREYLYWEFQGRQAIRTGRWKAVRLKPSAAVELYDLTTDPAETKNVSTAHPDVMRRLTTLLTTARTESALFPLSRG
mgnify:FL=1